MNELEDLSDSGPEVDTLSITSTPKPSLRPYFSSTRSLLVPEEGGGGVWGEGGGRGGWRCSGTVGREVSVYHTLNPTSGHSSVVLIRYWCQKRGEEGGGECMGGRVCLGGRGKKGSLAGMHVCELFFSFHQHVSSHQCRLRDARTHISFHNIISRLIYAIRYFIYTTPRSYLSIN